MLISLIKYPITTLGPGKRIGVWTSGCFRDCPGCMSSFSKGFDQEKNRSISSIVDEIKEIVSKNKVDGITISGGDPFLQEDLDKLLEEISNIGIDDVLVYTGFLFEELVDKKELFKNIGVLIDGPYIEELNDNKPLRGSSNQNIYILKKNLKERYLEYLKQPRRFDIDISNGVVTIIGILPKDGKKYINDIFNQ